MEQPSSLEALTDRSQNIQVSRLIKNGRNLTLDQFLSAKESFESNEKEKQRLIQDRQTFVIYKDKVNKDKTKPVNKPDIGVFSQFCAKKL